MLAGETPFTGDSVELLKLHSTSEPAPIQDKNPRVPKRMARLVMAALAKNPAERPDTAPGFTCSTGRRSGFRRRSGPSSAR
jgi:serine/threonine-protein kinase